MCRAEFAADEEDDDFGYYGNGLSKTPHNIRNERGLDAALLLPSSSAVIPLLWNLEINDKEPAVRSVAARSLASIEKVCGGQGPLMKSLDKARRGMTADEVTEMKAKLREETKVSQIYSMKSFQFEHRFE